MGKLINVDNGGTLTDFCVLDGETIYHTKSLTTPFDLSKCFFDGMKKLAHDIYGDEKHVDELLQTTDYIRYSTTQGTNALVERKGPQLGLLTDRKVNLAALAKTEAEESLFRDLIDDRVGIIDPSLEGSEAQLNIINALNEVCSAGASRIVLSIDHEGFKGMEARLCAIIDRNFPSHLLGVVPVVSAGELADDSNYGRRTWTAIINAFLHPAMERFLYSADHRLKSHKTRNPLLIFRNDGGAARVAKTMAIKSYGSGPRGGMEGVKALADHYSYSKLLSYDVGGTTTDIGVVEDGVLKSNSHGQVEGVEITFPIANIFSAGVGGSSVIDTNGTQITVGPESVGAAPGPACFGLGGKRATITDVFLLMGVLDPSTYFGGELSLDADRAKEVVMATIAEPLGLALDQALDQMFDAWVQKIATAISQFSPIDAGTTLAGFGGAGALAATRIADATGAKRVIIPGMGAVFCAMGIGFSPLSQSYRFSLTEHTEQALDEIVKSTHQRAKKDMFAEGVNIEDCVIDMSLLRVRGGEESFFPISDKGGIPCDLDESDRVLLIYEASKNIQSLKFNAVGDEELTEIKVSAMRNVRMANGSVREVPVVRVEEQQPGATTDGPAIVEEAFFTGFIDEGWRLMVSGNNDLILTKCTED